MRITSVHVKALSDCVRRRASTPLKSSSASTVTHIRWLMQFPVPKRDKYVLMSSRNSECNIVGAVFPRVSEQFDTRRKAVYIKTHNSRRVSNKSQRVRHWCKMLSPCALLDTDILYKVSMLALHCSPASFSTTACTFCHR